MNSSSTQPLRIITHSRQSSRGQLQLQKQILPSQLIPPISSRKQIAIQQPIQNQSAIERDLLQTRNSFCSRQSRRSSRFSSTSRSSWCQQIEDFNSMSMSKLSDLLDGLLSLRLDYLSKGQPEQNNRSIVNDINRKLQLIKRIIMSKDRYQQTPQMYSSISQKIQMIDKIMAEQWVQSEKKFNAVISKSTNNNYGGYGSTMSSQKMKQMNSIPQRIDTMAIPNCTQSMVTQTRYKSEYQSPNHQSIKLYKIPKRKYLRNNAPMPSSNYNREYYDYKSIVKSPVDNYRESSNLSLGYHKSKLRSNYKSDYTQSQAVKEDYKQLDCYRNKIRTLKMMFISKKQGPTKQELFNSISKKDKNIFSPKNSLNHYKAYDGQFLSNNKNDYKLPSIFCDNKPKFSGIQRMKMGMKYKSIDSKYTNKQNIIRIKAGS